MPIICIYSLKMISTYAMIITANKRNANEPTHARAFLVTGNTRGHGLA